MKSIILTLPITGEITGVTDDGNPIVSKPVLLPSLSDLYAIIGPATGPTSTRTKKIDVYTGSAKVLVSGPDKWIDDLASWASGKSAEDIQKHVQRVDQFSYDPKAKPDAAKFPSFVAPGVSGDDKGRLERFFSRLNSPRAKPRGR